MPPPLSHPLPQRNLPYATREGQELLLDLYPAGVDTLVRAEAGPGSFSTPSTLHAQPDAAPAPGPTPLVLYLHDGGWRSGSKDDCPLRWLTRYGYAVASINYRLAPRHRFPAPLFDARDAVRFLRSRAEDFGLDASRFAAAGVSSGAHLACLLALTTDHPGLCDPPGESPHAEASCRVGAVINYYGFTDFLAMRDRRSRRVNGGANTPEAVLLGHPVGEDIERARLASPAFHVGRPQTVGEGVVTPAFLHLHGDLNEVVSMDQTRRFHAALEEAGLVSKMVVVRGAGHGGPLLFGHRSIRDRVADFLRRYL